MRLALYGKRLRVRVEYAFHEGVPFAILTDGQQWQFFLPGERGDYSERRVHKPDLAERDPIEASSILTARFGRWHPATVRNLIHRANADSFPCAS